MTDFNLTFVGPRGESAADVDTLVDDVAAAVAFEAEMRADVVEIVPSVNLYDPDTMRVAGYYVSSGNTIAADAAWAYAKIPVSPGDVVAWTTNTTRRDGSTWLDAGGVPLSGQYQATAGVAGVNYTRTAPSGAAFLALNIKSNSIAEPTQIMVNLGLVALTYQPYETGLAINPDALPEDVRTLSEDLYADVLTTIPPVNRYNPADKVAGSYITSAGAIAADASWGMVFIDVTGLDFVTINANTERRAGSAFYTAKNTGGYMSGTYSGAATRPEVRAVPEGALWLGVNLYSNTITEPTEFIVSATTGAVDYEPYAAPTLGIRAAAVVEDDEDEDAARLVLSGADTPSWVESGFSGSRIRRQFTPFFTPNVASYPAVLNLGDDVIDGTAVRSPVTDDSAPDHTAGTTLGANHGYIMGLCTAAAHGKTTADEGSRWTCGGVACVLVKVPGTGTLYLARETTNSVPPAGAYTHVSGATNTAGFTVTGTPVSTQWYPPHTNRALSVSVDGRRIAETQGEFPIIASAAIVETVDMLAREDIIAWWIANGGASGGFEPEGDPLYTMTRAYRFDRYGQLTIAADWTFLRDTVVADLMGLQAERIGNPTYIVPSAVPFTYDGETLDYGLGVSSGRTLAASGTPSIEFGASKLQATGEYGDRVLILYDDALVAMGFLPVGDAAPDVRRSRVSANTIEIRGNTGKVYMRALDVGDFTATEGDHYDVIGYRVCVPRVGTEIPSYVVEQNDHAAFIYADWQDAEGLARVDLPPHLIGRTLTVIDQRNATLMGEGGTATGSLSVLLDAAGDRAYLIVKASA